MFYLQVDIGEPKASLSLTAYGLLITANLSPDPIPLPPAWQPMADAQIELSNYHLSYEKSDSYFPSLLFDADVYRYPDGRLPTR
jgi:hypothetical protein